MNNQFKKTALWSLYIIIVAVALFTIMSLCVNVFAPTFFPEKDISGFKDYINTLCVILTFLSVGLSIYSIWKMAESNKQASEMLLSINELKHQQELILVSLKSLDDKRVVLISQLNGSWNPDNDID